MGDLSRKAVSLLSATGFPFWGFQFHLVGLTGTCRFSDREIRILYGGTRPFFRYFKEMSFSGSPTEEHLGTFNVLKLGRIRRNGDWDLEVFRGHQTLAKAGMFPSSFFVPEWISGTADLAKQRECDKTSKSRRRDRAILERNNITYSVTTDQQDLDHFYDEMYLPHIGQEHADSDHLMTREQMRSYVQESNGRLVVIRRDSEPVGGSLIIEDKGRPRLYSQGILHNDIGLKRSGVGTAVYLYSFDHLLESGYSDVHMGWSRALLSDGSLYFKQRFGLRLAEASRQGHFISHAEDSDVAADFLSNTGLLHSRRGPIRAAVFQTGGAKQKALVSDKLAQCWAMGVDNPSVIHLEAERPRPYARDRKQEAS